MNCIHYFELMWQISNDNCCCCSGSCLSLCWCWCCVVVLLWFHIYLFNCAINVRVYAMQEWHGKMIVETDDDEPALSKHLNIHGINTDWKNVSANTQKLLIFFNGIILASWTTGFSNETFVIVHIQKYRFRTAISLSLHLSPSPSASPSLSRVLQLTHSYFQQVNTIAREKEEDFLHPQSVFYNLVHRYPLLMWFLCVRMLA